MPRRPLATALLCLILCGAGDARQAVPVLDPNAVLFPDASLPPATDLLQAPAGTRGFVFSGMDGRFYFADGTRARFFGINVAKDSVFQPPEVIDRAIAAIARAGFNLVRLHHVDDEGGLLPAALAGQTPRIARDRLETLDYWVAGLKTHGIYVCLDLLDFRTFREEEGVPSGPALGRGAKPYAFFNERLIQLQRRYAQELLFDHINVHTGLSYAADPAVCMVELCDENGLFHQRKRLGALVAPYGEELVRRWNYWLLATYGSRDKLAQAWTDETRECSLCDDEDPRRGTVALPGVSEGAPEEAARMADRGTFFADLHREYFRGMVSFLRARGLRCPISAVSEPDWLPDLWASAQELDFIATNYYFDHPYYRPGSEWQLPAFFTGQNVLGGADGDSFAATVAACRVPGKPIVIREWGVCWPNPWRGAGMLEATAYACLQDVDAMILFTLDTRADMRKLGFFDVRSDPLRWGLASVCARMYLSGQLEPARHSAAIHHSEGDVFLANGGAAPAAIHQLGRVCRVSNLLGDEASASPGDITIASGRAADAEYSGERTVICSDHFVADAHGRRGPSAAERSGYPAPQAAVKGEALKFGGTMFPAGATRTLPSYTPFAVSEVTAREHLRPFGTSADGARCLGIRDMRRENYVFGELSSDLKLRVSMDLLGRVVGRAIGHEAVERGRFTSDTGQIVVARDLGLMWIKAPGILALAGDAKGSRALTAGALTLHPNTSPVACVWQSLDGSGPEASRNWMVKYVTGARNEGQQVRVHQEKKDGTIYALDKMGQAPVHTDGRPATDPVRIVLGEQTVLVCYMQGGTLELCRDGEDYYLFCDTPGSKIELPSLQVGAPAAFYAPVGEEPAVRHLQQPFVWPEGTALVHIRAAEG